MTSNAIWLISILALMSALIVFAVFVIQRRRAVVIEPLPAEDDVISGEIISANES